MREQETRGAADAATGTRGVSRLRAFTVTTERNDRQRPAPDLVDRRFAVAAPNQLWVADMTYIPTWCGFLYLAMVLDAFSRKVVGWSMGEAIKSSRSDSDGIVQEVVRAAHGPRTAARVA